MSSTDNKNLCYDALKTLNTPTEDSKSDFFGNNEEVYVPESFSAMFGDIIPEQEFYDVIDQVRKKKQDSENLFIYVYSYFSFFHFFTRRF